MNLNGINKLFEFSVGFSFPQISASKTKSGAGLKKDKEDQNRKQECAGGSDSTQSRGEGGGQRIT